MSERIESALKEEASWLSKRLKDQDEAGLRLGGYRPKIDTHYQCPTCWVLHNRRTNLDPISAGVQDVLGCDVCGGEFLV